MRTRAALCATATIAMLAVLLADGSDASRSAGADARSKPAAYLGPPDGGRAWMRSLPQAHSVIWAVGDGADGGADGQAVAAMIAAHRIDLFLYLGDVYRTGTAAEYASNYAPLFGRFDRIAAPTAGNHEWPNHSSGYGPYWTAVRGSPPPAWYTVAASGWQLISLNSNMPSAEGSAQLEWLQRELARSPRFGSCRLAFLHVPRFSAGSHGDDPELEPVVEALAGRARILLSGHDHDMQRFAPMRGITQLVAGAGGTRLYPLNRADARLAFADDTHHGALRLKLRPEKAVLSFVAADGSLLDRSAVRCRQNLR